MSELDHALKLSTVMFGIVGFRENGSDAQAATADIRARAFTIFTRAYDDARRAVIFLRWHEGDADSIAPSLHPGRSAGKKKLADEPNVTSPVTAPVASSAQPTVPTNNSGATPAAKTDIEENGPFMR